MKVNDNPKVYVGTYRKYNNGDISGEWVDLTDYDDAEEFFEYCREIHSDEEDPEFMFQDFENFPKEMYCESMSAKDLEPILRYAQLKDYEREVFNAYIGYFGYDDDWGIDKIYDKYHGEADSEEDFAERILDECYPDMPEFARRYFDIKAFARDLFMCDYEFCDGHVFSCY